MADTDGVAVESLRVQAWAASHAGNRDYAAQLFRQILKDHPDSQAATDARLYFEGDPDRASQGLAPPIQLVRVIEFDIGFLNMVGLFIKAAFAAIPAAIIVYIIWTVALAFLAGAIGRI